MRTFCKFLLTAALAVMLAIAMPAIAATVSASFTTVSAGAQFPLRQKESATYSVSGTFTATAVLERTRDGGQTWQTVGTFAATASGTVVNESPRLELYRFRTTAYTSGTVVTSLVDSADILHEWRAKDGTLAFRIKDDGTETAGSMSPATITPTGQILAAAGTASAPGYSFAVDSNTGIYSPGVDGSIDLVTNANPGVRFNGNLILSPSLVFGWASSSSPWTSSDTPLARESAGVLLFSNSSNAMTFKVAKTYTSGSNYLATQVTGDGMQRVGAGASYAGVSMGACGTSPSVSGNGFAMQVTVGSGGSATSCAVTFGAAFSSPPVCVAQNNTDRVAYSMVTTTTTATWTAGAAFTAGSIFHVLCNGR